MAVNYGLNRALPFPVRSNSKIRARIALLALKELSDAAAQVMWSFNGYVQHRSSPCGKKVTDFSARLAHDSFHD